MPIQNVGTLLENLVVAEATALMLDRLCGARLGFACAFAMPTLSEWRPHRQNIGISTDVLQRVAQRTDDNGFTGVMARCLQYKIQDGPNGVLLASLVASLRKAALRVWANDIVVGHYGNAIPSLETVQELVERIVPGCQASITVTCSETPFPESLGDMETVLENWKGEVGGVLGFLDPDRYVLSGTEGPYVSSAGHRRWLTSLRKWDQTLSVHFTGNRDARSLTNELDALRTDVKESGFPCWLEIRRQHYVVSVAAKQQGILDDLEARIASSWATWCGHASEIRSTTLLFLKSGD